MKFIRSDNDGPWQNWTVEDIRPRDIPKPSIRMRRLILHNFGPFKARAFHREVRALYSKRRGERKKDASRDDS